MSAYEYIINHLATVYRSTINTDKHLRIIAKVFDDFDDTLQALATQQTIDTADEIGLGILGRNVGRPKKIGETLETYRKILLIEYFKYYTMPTHDNILTIIKKVTNDFPVQIPLMQTSETGDLDLGYSLNFFIDLGFPTEILELLMTIYPDGIKLKDGDYSTLFESKKYLQAMIFYDFMKIELRSV